MSPTVTLQDVGVRSEITNDDVNANNALLEAALNGPSLGGTGIEQVNLAANTPVVVSGSIAGLGSVRAGKAGLLRPGFSLIAVVYDATLGKWVSDAFPAIGQQEADSVTATAYPNFPLTAQEWPMCFLPDYQAIYNAGLRLQVFVAALLDNSGANTTFLRARLGLLNAGEAALTAGDAAGEISNVGTTATYKTSGWVTLSTTTPSKAYAYLCAEARTTAGTATISQGTIMGRWVST